jgi:signal transduction histidine kinase
MGANRIVSPVGMTPTRSELDEASVRFLVPGMRRGFATSAVPLLCIAILLWANDVDGTTTWVTIRAALSVSLYAVLVRLGDGMAHPARTMRSLIWIQFVGGIGWGVMPFMIDTSELEWFAVVMFVLIANLAIVTTMCAVDRRVYAAAMLPVFLLGLLGLVLASGEGPIKLAWLYAFGGPYSYSIFLVGHRALVERIALDLKNQALVAELESQRAVLSEANERLHEATARQALLLDERAALISSVGHDLGSPLGAAMLTAEILADHPDAVPAEQHRELASRIRSQVHDAVTVLRDLTSSQRLNETDIEARRSLVDLGDIVALVVERHRSAEQQIDTSIGPDSWVWADPALLERIVDNLLGNAVKYTPARSTIVIGGDIVDPAEGTSVLWVDDDGPGLPEGLEDTMFEPYVRGAAVSATSGSGVGLFLVRSFVAMHGGRVWWEPSVRGGSRFVVSLPGRPPVPEHAAAGDGDR